MNVPSSKAVPDGVSGLVERVTFHSPETGFAVMRVTVKGRREPMTVVGTVASVNTGEWITAQGTWVRDREHGLQLKADSITCSPPNSREGIERYLGSGLIKGIGPVYAKKLVDKFGEEIFTIIEECSVRLEEIEGIGPTRRRKIKAAWAEQKVVREIMVFLHSHGVSTSRALRIYKTYGEKAIETVRSDPYTLAKEIHGIGFKSADLIAQKLGLPRDSIIRTQAGITHALLDATNQGHCALPRATLFERAIQLLNVNVGIVEQALERLILNAEVVSEHMGERHLIYLSYLRRAEHAVAMLVRKLGSAPSQLPPINIEKAITWCEQQTGKELAPTQREAVRKALENRALVITGGPGVGKTTLVQSILLILRAKKLNCVLCAPTGRAAKRLSEVTGLEAKTIHRLLEFQPAYGGFARNAEHPLECDVLVSDESSMIDLPLFHKLIQALSEHAHLLLVGDIDQLPSIGPGTVLADIIRSNVIPVVRLTEIFRQSASSRISASAHCIRAGQMPQIEEPNKESDFFFIERDEPIGIESTIVTLVKERIPKKLGLDPILDVQVLCPMNRGSLGAREMNMLLQQRLNPARDGDPTVERFGWQFRLRDKVIQTENDYDKEVFNGDIGQIVKIQPEEQELTVRFDDRDVPYDFGELDEISLAYAITIHKSQGSEFPAVVIPLAMQHYLLLQRNLVYTAITRGRQMVVLVGQKRALANAVRNDNVDERFSALYDRLLNHESMTTANGR
ncbi:MAG TPA: ATP-dependent RecD-like DNA helicase [Chthoniobacterales bacterium]|nr:ATP-dependent RecD-like DNA helicase [Chthoniobacterales bacterium]